MMAVEVMRMSCCYYRCLMMAYRRRNSTARAVEEAFHLRTTFRPAQLVRCVDLAVPCY